MKSIVLEEAGGVENLIFKDIEQPATVDGEVLVKVEAISINPVDVKIKYAEEGLNNLYGEERPVILGWDIAGTVIATGNAVSLFEVGDAVFGMVNFPGKGKAYAELVAAPESQLAKIPSNVSYKEAAATTLAALTALQAIQNTVKAGDRVLVHAGSGGVGHFAIQIAKNMGAHVVATSSAKNRDFIMSLGADEHIDYQTQAFEKVASKIDFVLDTLGGEVLSKSLDVMVSGGSIVSITTFQFSKELLEKATLHEVKMSALMVHSNGEDMNTLKGMLAEGIIKPHLSKAFPFTEMAKAHAEVESGRTVGKIVIRKPE